MLYKAPCGPLRWLWVLLRPLQPIYMSNGCSNPYQLLLVVVTRSKGLKPKPYGKALPTYGTVLVVALREPIHNFVYFHLRNT